MKYELKDRIIPAIGELSIYGYDPSGNLVLTDLGPNMIMELAKDTLAHLIGGDASGNSLVSIAFGADDSVPNPGDDSIGGISTESLSPGDNFVGDTLMAYQKSLSSHSYPEIGKVSFSWSLDYLEGNGLPLVEFGLITGAQTLFARKTRNVISKASDLSLGGTWSIRF